MKKKDFKGFQVEKRLFLNKTHTRRSVTYHLSRAFHKMIRTRTALGALAVVGALITAAIFFFAVPPEVSVLPIKIIDRISLSEVVEKIREIQLLCSVAPKVVPCTSSSYYDQSSELLVTFDS